MVENLKSNHANCSGVITRNDPLPVLPPGIPRLLRVLADEDIDYQKLELIIGQFPSITARLLFLANSAWAAPKIPVTSLKMACSRLGLKLVRSVSIALAVSSPFNPARCPAFNAECFWCTALLVADGAVLLLSCAENNKQLDTPTVHTAGLLHNLGLLWLADHKPEQTAKAFEAAADDEMTVKQSLQDIVGADYCQIGGCLGRAWSLPAILSETMEHYDKPDYSGIDSETITVVGAAAAMVSALFKELDSPPEDFVRLEGLNIKPADRDEVYLKLSEKLKDTRELARTLFDA